jgi:hypothetical protein
MNTFTANPGSSSTAAYLPIWTQYWTAAGNAQNIATVYGAAFQTYHNGTGTVGTNYGVAAWLANLSTGTITNAHTLDVGGTNASTGTIGTYSAVYVHNVTNSGSITNNYGLYLESQTGGSSNYAIYSAGGQSYLAGNLGIGTSTPGSKLEVDGNIALTSGSGASIAFADGTTQSTAWTGTTCGGDYAESVDVTGDRTHYEPGDVLVMDEAVEGSFLRSAEPYSTSVTGVYSTKPGLVGRRQLTDRSRMSAEVPMAMTGIVPTKVTAENGPIRVGDLLVTSSRIGYAMKGSDRSKMLGAVIGKALGHLDSGVGVIEVVVTLQ